MSFPATRMRRLRASTELRALTRETRLSPDRFVYPIFVTSDRHGPDPIPSMPGQYRWPIDSLRDLARDVYRAGIRGVMVFGLPDHKDETGSEAHNPDGIVQRAIRELKDAVPGLLTIADTCLCEYTSHGHCGILRDGYVDNDATLDVLAQVAVSQATAGADMVAPSDMMDGRIRALRDELDSAGFEHLPMLAYTAKYASAFYGPFREAADCAPQFGDRKSYQMDPGNRREALREAMLDVQEGADILMVKPALPYLDIVRQVRDNVDLPLWAYNVSGEYAMVKAAGRAGWVDERAVTLELLTAIVRAGADTVLTYHACEAAQWLQEV
ncbi:MAG: porphobilinogen synthase [Chloroflexota bacterium]